MKRLLVFLLTVIMVVSLCSCGGTSEAVNNTTEQAEISTSEQVWSIQLTTDAFGDITENSKPFLVSLPVGSFSNTATQSSDLLTSVAIMLKPNGHYVVQFSLFEYGDVLATYLNSDTLSLKVKVDDVIVDYCIYEAITSAKNVKIVQALLDHGAKPYYGKDRERCLAEAQKYVPSAVPALIAALNLNNGVRRNISVPEKTRRIQQGPQNYRQAEYDPEKYCYMNDGISGERCKFCHNVEHSQRGTRAFCKQYDQDVNDNYVCDQFKDEMAELISATIL